MDDKRFAMVCASNVNRSVAAHEALVKNSFSNVFSYGTGSAVRMPGPRGASVYDFGTPYQRMFDELSAEDWHFFTRSGVLAMLERDAAVKLFPQKWQNEKTAHIASLDVILCFEDRVFDAVVEGSTLIMATVIQIFNDYEQPSFCIDIQTRGARDFKPVHVICLSVRDSPEDAVLGANLALNLCSEVLLNAYVYF